MFAAGVPFNVDKINNKIPILRIIADSDSLLYYSISLFLKPLIYIHKKICINYKSNYTAISGGGVLSSKIIQAGLLDFRLDAGS